MLRPLKDRILVKPIERKQSEILEVVGAEKYNVGTVIAVGPGKLEKGRIKPLDVRPGDRVRFGESKANTAIDFPRHSENGIEYLILQEADVCFIEEAGNP